MQNLWYDIRNEMLHSVKLMIYDLKDINENLSAPKNYFLFCNFQNKKKEHLNLNCGRLTNVITTCSKKAILNRLLTIIYAV